MTFSSGNTTADTLLNKLADDLIATGAWADADPALVGSERVVSHIADGGFFVHFKRQVVTPLGNNRFNEIMVEVSSGWDSGANAPTGTIERTGIPLEAWQDAWFDNPNHGWAAGGSAGSGDKVGQFWLWLDSNGFALLHSWDPAGGFDYSGMLVLERNTTKEYADGYTNFFLLARTNSNVNLRYDPSSSTNIDWYESEYFGNRDFVSGDNTFKDVGRAFYIRPFNVVEYDTFQDGVYTFFSAYRSDGNSKVYFGFPWYSNNLSQSQRTPIAQTERWFEAGTGLGLADGDLVDVVVGAQTNTYLVKTLQSPDSASFLSVAIRQA